LLTVWRAGVWGLLWGWLIGGLLALAWLRRSPHRPPLAPAFPAEAVALARAGFPLFAFFSLTLVLRSLDRIALVRFGGNQALGHYSLGLIAAGLVLYLPEAAAAVLFPRIAAAAEGARDPGRTRAEVVRAQRALMALLPLPVALGALWTAPLVTRVLPAFEGGIPALRILVLGALLMAGATLPVHFLLGVGRGRSLLAPGAGAVLGAGLLVFGVASRMPWATAVAIASALGQGLFAIVMLALAARTLAGDAAARRGLVVATLGPALWAAALALALAPAGGGGVAAATWHSAVFVAGYAPALLLFGRGLGLRRALREWLLPA
jgi:O-antigen/teichoic acid export membrane protein